MLNTATQPLTKLQINVFGNPKLGKTTLLEEYQHGNLLDPLPNEGNPQISEAQPLLGYNFQSKEIKIDQETVKLQIYEHLPHTNPKIVGWHQLFYSKSDGAIVVFDPSQQDDSFENLNREIEAYYEKAGSDKPLLFLVKAVPVNSEQQTEDKKINEFIETLKKKYTNIITTPGRINTSGNNIETINQAFDQIATKALELHKPAGPHEQLLDSLKSYAYQRFNNQNKNSKEHNNNDYLTLPGRLWGILFAKLSSWFSLFTHFELSYSKAEKIAAVNLFETYLENQSIKKDKTASKQCQPNECTHKGLLNSVRSAERGLKIINQGRVGKTCSEFFKNEENKKDFKNFLEKQFSDHMQCSMTQKKIR